MRCSPAASKPRALGAFDDDPLFGLDGRQKLGLNAAIELGAVFLRDIGCRTYDVLSQLERV